MRGCMNVKKVTSASATDGLLEAIEVLSRLRVQLHFNATRDRANIRRASHAAIRSHRDLQRHRGWRLDARRHQRHHRPQRHAHTPAAEEPPRLHSRHCQRPAATTSGDSNASKAAIGPSCASAPPHSPTVIAAMQTSVRVAAVARGTRDRCCRRGPEGQTDQQGG